MTENGPEPRQYLPLTCHGHSRPVPHLAFSSLERDGEYFMISACKDGNPMLRHGKTGDWIGTFIGHKGATWQAKLSPDNSIAASASADFSVKIWDAHSGEMLLVLKHDHVARAIAFPLRNSDIVATGGHEKILRIWGLKREDYKQLDDVTTDENGTMHVPHTRAFSVGTVHPDTIKSIVWTNDMTIVTAAGKTLRWHNVDKRNVFKEQHFDQEIKSCEMVSLAPEFTSPTDIGEGRPILCVAAGKSVYFFSTAEEPEEIKRFNLKHGVASVGLDLKSRKFVVGEEPGTWARSYDWEGNEMDVMKGHHGPIWCIQFAPDGKLYATGSEDGTIRMWKNCDEDYGLWRDRGTATAERNEHTSSRAGASAAPLNEISANVARIPPATLPDGKEPAAGTGKVDSDASGFWKVMLSPVAEESPSPRKRSPRKTKGFEENALLNCSPQKHALQGTYLQGSPPKAPVLPLSPGSLKMKNFLRRLERQGLSHD